MIDGLRRIAEEMAKRLGPAVSATGEQIVRRYREICRGVETDVSVKEGTVADRGADIEERGREMRTGDDGARATDAPMRPMSMDEFVARIRAAESSGEPEIRTPRSMLLVYPDGFEVVYKTDLSPREWSAEILASAVGRAIGAPVAPVVGTTEGDLFIQRLPGLTVRETDSDPGAHAAMKAVEDTPGARKLGLLDVLVRNWDRPNNWLLDGDQVYGYDHAESFQADMDFDPESNPFTSHYAVPSSPGASQWHEWKPNDLSRAELDRYRDEIVALRPLFEEHARMDWATAGQPREWHDDILARLAQLREHATYP